MRTRSLLGAVLALGAASLTACATTNDRASTTTTTGAYQPGNVELYLARDGKAPCREAIATNVDFAPGAADLDASEKQHMDAWARCLNEPAMRETTIIVTGSVDPTEQNQLFRGRAQAIRDALVARGVDPRRVLVAGDTSQGPRSSQNVKVDFTSSVTPKAIAPKDPVVRQRVR